MAEAETIQEFLIGLSWKLDTAASNKFKETVDSGTKSVDRIATSMLKQEGASKGFREAVLKTTVGMGGLAVGAGAAAVAIDAFVTASSANMARLYFATKNLGGTADAIEDVRLSFSKAGVAVGEVDSVLNNIRQRQIETPAINDILTKNLGVNPADLGDTTKVLKEMSQALHDMPNEQLAYQYAKQFGIPLDMFQAIRRGVTQGSTYGDLYKNMGLDPAKMTADATTFQNKLKELDAAAIVFGQFAESELNAPMAKFVDLLEKAAAGIVAFQGRIHKEGFASVDAQIGGEIAQRMRDAGVPDWAVDLAFGKVGAVGDRIGTAARGVAGVTTQATDTNAEIADAYFQSQGWSPAAAAGIIGNLTQESGVGADPRMNADPTHQGIAQWDYTRQAEFRHLYGHDIAHATLQEQLAFINHELTKGRYKAVGDVIRNATDAGQAATVVQNGYEVAPGQDDVKRAQYAYDLYNRLGGAPTGGDGVSNSQVNHITVHGATDPQATAKAVNRELQDSLRYFLPAVQ